MDRGIQSNDYELESSQWKTHLETRRATEEESATGYSCAAWLCFIVTGSATVESKGLLGFVSQKSHHRLFCSPARL
jgi:hypothetical protein